MTQDRTRAIVEAAENLEQAIHERAEQQTAGRNAMLADLEYAVEHGGALDGSIARECVRQIVRAVSLPSPSWTRTPPSEPGYYWNRKRCEDGSFAVCGVLVLSSMRDAPDDGCEWWPVPITPPEAP